jgi:hypothetical protein
MATEKDKSSKSSGGGGLILRGRFPAGSRVRLTKSAGPHQLRVGPTDEEIDVQTVDEDGNLEFSGVEPGERYFASGIIGGQPREVRLTGSADPDNSLLAGYEPIRSDRAKKQWRKQEPVNPLLELQEDPGESPARTSERQDVTPAGGSGRRTPRKDDD